MKKISGFIVCFLLAIFVFSQPRNASFYYEAGKEFQAKGDYFDAIEQFQQALAINPSYGECWFGLAECAYETEEYSLAMTYIQKAAVYMTDDSALKNLQGFTEIALGKLNEARITFLSVLEKFPNDVDARFGLAELELFAGKVSGAEQWYEDALQRQHTNRKALISLALVNYELGNIEKTREYIQLAKDYHSGSPEVYYFAAYLDILDKNYEMAEGHVRSALILDSDYEEASQLLSIILFDNGRFEECIEICDQGINRNRNHQANWYMKAMSLWKMDKVQESLETFEKGLTISPDNEVFRAAMEIMVNENLPLEDERRKEYALYHGKRANEEALRFYSDSALYEYRIALRLNPSDNNLRKNYAELLLREDCPENYLAQMEFISRTDKSRDVKEIVETYQSHLRKSLVNRWDVNPLLLEKGRISLGLYPVAENPQLLHPECENIVSKALADNLKAFPYFMVSSQDYVSGYTEAFRNARYGKEDYFGLISLEESEREINIFLKLYSGRTGNKCGEFAVYRTGNYRFANAIQKLTDDLIGQFPVRGKIIARQGDNLLLDSGSRDGIKKDDVLTIVKKDRLNTADIGIGLSCHEDDIFGTVTITHVGEDVSQGVFNSKGFYDRINIGDEVFLAMPSEEVKDDKTPEKSKKLFFKKADDEAETKKDSVLTDFDLTFQRPLLLQLIQNIN